MTGLRFSGVELPLAEFALELDVHLPGPVTAIVGPSGAGKTSLLEIVAGLRVPRRGRVELDGETFSDADRGVRLPPRARRIGYVPQDDTLFPHLSVSRNLLYGAPEGERGARFERAVSSLGLSSLLGRAVANLSGGERRRVAIGRALLSQPRLLLCDEPLAGLDRDRKLKILEHLRAAREEWRVPLLYVAHDAEEIRLLEGDVLSLDRGRARFACARDPQDGARGAPGRAESRDGGR